MQYPPSLSSRFCSPTPQMPPPTSRGGQRLNRDARSESVTGGDEETKTPPSTFRGRFVHSGSISSPTGLFGRRFESVKLQLPLSVEVVVLRFDVQHTGLPLERTSRSILRNEDDFVAHLIYERVLSEFLLFSIRHPFAFGVLLPRRKRYVRTHSESNTMQCLQNHVKEPRYAQVVLHVMLYCPCGYHLDM